MVTRKSKYLGNVYDGRWKVIEIVYYKNTHNQKYVLENIFNSQKITIGAPQMNKIANGKSSVYVTMGCRIRKERARKKYELHEKQMYGRI